ncbi:hypothetical protein FHR70_000711 [Microvirga lupini]|uniref:Uncharacterized protein n=1 Tax=Microvirga lupini TaxID=420324 RepID=A0A7W4VJ10_9HYPH|nr:hypothetical protein [Microvirga lupini]MBB3017671.1 hypothetical protein [Microvirga lupini]
MSLVEQRRDAFEQAVIERFKESGFLEVEIRVECLGRSGDGYADSSVDAYWAFWNKALDSVVIELPMVWAGGSFKEGAMSAVGVRDAIEAAGLKVAS